MWCKMTRIALFACCLLVHAEQASPNPPEGMV